MKFGDLIWVHYIYHWAGCSPQAYTVREESMLVPQNLCVWNLKLPDVGACVRWLATGMSTRLWTIQYRMVTRAFARWPSKGSQPIRPSIAEKHYWYSRLLPGLSPLCGLISYLNIQGWIISWCLAQVMLEESTGLSMWIPRCIFMERYTSVHVIGSGSFCSCGWPLVM